MHRSLQRDATSDLLTYASYFNTPIIKRNRMIILLAGPTASGKDSLADKLEVSLGVPKIGPNNILRELKNGRPPQNELERELIKKGKNGTTDEDRVGLLAIRAARPDCARGFIVISFPRTLEQAKIFDTWLQKSGERASVLYNIDIANVDILKRRIEGRWTHLNSGRSYHIDSVPPKSMKLVNGVADPSTMLDDETGEQLVQRTDDLKGAAELDSKYAEWKAGIAAMMEHYRMRPDFIMSINGDRKPDVIYNDVVNHVKQSGFFRSISTKRKRAIVLLAGPTASGKDSLADKLEASLGIPKIGPNNILRELKNGRPAENELERQLIAKGKGGTTDDDRVGLVAIRAARPDCAKGFILISFPRTIEQAKIFDDWLQKAGEEASVLYNINIPNVDILKRRVEGRWSHLKSGRSYHVDSVPPKSMKLVNGVVDPSTMLDDETGEQLVQRTDDLKGAAELDSKYAEWKKGIADMMEHYNTRPQFIVSVDGNRAPAVIYDEVMSHVNQFM